jgi:hypothetical protein
LGVADRASYLDIGIVVLKALAGGSFQVVARKANSVDRQSELSVELEAGVTYVVIPRTSGCALQRPPNAPRENLKLIEGGEMNPLFIVTLIDLFKKFNLSLSNYLSKLQFKHLFQVIGVTITDEDIGHISANYACTKDGLSLDGFLSYMHHQTIQYGENTIWSWLELWGYDRDLYSIGTRRFVFTIHSTDHLEVTMRKQLGTGLSNLVDKLLLQIYGVKKSNMRDIRLYCLYEAKANAFIDGVFNSGKESRQVEFDATRSEGVLYGSGSAVSRHVVSANSWEVLNYFQISKHADNCKISPQLRVR